LGSNWLLNFTLESKGITKDHLAAKGCPGFAVEFNIYHITGVDSDVA